MTSSFLNYLFWYPVIEKFCSTMISEMIIKPRLIFLTAFPNVFLSAAYLEYQIFPFGFNKGGKSNLLSDVHVTVR